MTEVSGIGPNKAKVLRQAGFQDRAALIAATQSELADVDEIGNTLAARIKADVGGY